MSINFVVAVLTYFMILVTAYIIVIFTNYKEETSEEIIVRAYNHAFVILAFGLFVVYTLIILPHITLDDQLASYLILISKFISILTLGGSLFLLTRKKYTNE